jgi:NADH-quinone oxidoreductase subunit L
MALALIVLAIGSIVAGYVGLPAPLGGSNWFAHFLEPSFHVEAAHEAADVGLEGTLMIVSSGVALAGIGLAFYFFLRNRRAADAVAARFSALYRLLLNKYYVDEIYDATIVQPVRIASEEGLWKVVDMRVIDGSVNGVGQIVASWSDLLRRLQTGSVRAYAASLFAGVVAILGYYLWR